jgi:hypothetical protein
MLSLVMAICQWPLIAEDTCAASMIEGAEERG